MKNILTSIIVAGAIATRDISLVRDLRMRLFSSPQYISSVENPDNKGENEFPINNFEKLRSLRGYKSEQERLIPKQSIFSTSHGREDSRTYLLPQKRRTLYSHRRN
ncbi:MAG: hypothetical protein Q8Q31_03400 [Nanoarchaeota archaeon]|nr:hypothetical protein [Nanoarchaeota archaeon]